MSIVVLVQSLPFRPDNGQTVGVFLAGGGSRPYNQLGRSDWRAGVRNVPRFTTSVGFEQSGATGGALPSSAAISLFPSDKAYASTLANLYWPGARVTVSTGDDEAAVPSYVVSLLGTVTEAKSAGGVLTLTIGDLSVDLNKPVLPDSFAGTGDLEGVEAATGRPKRRTWGYGWNIEGRILDTANNVYEFGDPARAWSSFEAVKDKGVSGPMTVIAWQGTALATLNALRAATPPTGGASVAPSIACVKWWTVPAGPLTADVRGEVGAGYVETVAQIAARVVGAYSTSITIANLAEAQGWQGAVAGIHCGEASETVANVLDRLLLPVSIIWVLQGDGQLVFRRMTWDGPVEQVTAVQPVERETVFQPLLTRRIGFQANNREQTDAEISSVLLSATDISYADGTPIEVLKPAQANADRTVANTAAAIIGQTAAATAADSAVFNSAVTILPSGQLQGAGGGQVSYSGIGGKLLGLLDNLFFGSARLLETANGAIASLANFKTSAGTAAAIAGQGALATQASARYADQISSLPISIQPSQMLGGQYIIAGTVAWSMTDSNSVETLKPEERGGNRTEARTSAAITGQGAFATKSTISGDADLSGALGLRLLASPADNNYLNADRMAWGEGGTVQGLKPGERGANVTETRTSAAIIGQGALSTLNQVTLNTTTIRRADGTTIVSETLIITQLGTAAAIQGQGTGATANNLQQLDPAAKAQLDAAGGAATGLTAAFGVAINKVIENGASVTYEAAVYRDAGGGSGNIYAQVIGGPAGSSNLIAEGGAGSVGASEPGGSIVTGTFTNNTGVKQNFTFTAAERRVPTSAGGAIRQSQSYLIIRG